jgi:membrane-bound lytic murein transglycosylase D
MLAAAEKEYQAGRANYSAGHLEAAKDNFDRAFDRLLMGPVPVKSDDRLQQEFDKIVEGTHQLELEALKIGDGFTEQQAEPAPIDEANEVTFPVDPNLKAQAEQELKTTRSDLPLTLNDEVAAYINYFSSKGRGFLEHGYIRSGRYREMILDTLRQEGVPQDLIYLAQAESGFHPLALSRAGARGMWQFMAGRGAEYGLSRNWWVDERQDPVKATHAAARHLKDLYAQFGDWYLAMAAYNSGPGTVQHAVERTGYADYWELYRRGVLPQETRNYVPIILAITIMSKNPVQYGLDRLTPENPVSGEPVTINYPVDLRLVAECVDSSVEILQALNPSLLRMTTPRDQAFQLWLPKGAAPKFQEAIAAIPPEMRVWWRYHRVAPEDSLAAIAKRYRTTVQAIQEANNLTGADLAPESKLIIPVAPGRRDAASDGSSAGQGVARYRVRKGDTVSSVADHFNVPPASLRKWNRLKGNSLLPGRVLVIHSVTPEPGDNPSSQQTTAKKAAGKRGTGDVKPTRVSVSTAEKAGSSPAGTTALTHRVKQGETLSSIASRYHVTLAELRRNNPKIPTTLRPGMVLIIRPER